MTELPKSLYQRFEKIFSPRRYIECDPIRHVAGSLAGNENATVGKNDHEMKLACNLSRPIFPIETLEGWPKFPGITFPRSSMAEPEKLVK